MPAEVLGQANLSAACDEVAARATQHFLQSSRIMSRCPRRAVRAPRLMKAAYEGILRKLIGRGWTAPRDAVRLSKPRLLLAVLRYGLV